MFPWEFPRGNPMCFHIGIPPWKSYENSKSIFDTAKQRADISLAGIIDYCSARHTYLIPYGAVVVCGLDDDFSSFNFPLKLENLVKEKKDACHTFDFVLNLVLGDKNGFLDPFFICSDN